MRANDVSMTISVSGLRYTIVLRMSAMTLRRCPTVLAFTYTGTTVYVACTTVHRTMRAPLSNQHPQGAHVARRGHSSQ
jgi:hypothetical protein